MGASFHLKAIFTFWLDVPFFTEICYTKGNLRGEKEWRWEVRANEGIAGNDCKVNFSTALYGLRKNAYIEGVEGRALHSLQRAYPVYSGGKLSALRRKDGKEWALRRLPADVCV